MWGSTGAQLHPGDPAPGPAWSRRTRRRPGPKSRRMPSRMTMAASSAENACAPCHDHRTPTGPEGLPFRDQGPTGGFGRRRLRQRRSTEAVSPLPGPWGQLLCPITRSARNRASGPPGRRKRPSVSTMTALGSSAATAFTLKPQRVYAIARHKRGCPGTVETVRGSPFSHSARRREPYASFVRFGPPPAACSIGGTSGRGDFSSPRKLNFFASPSPSVSTTTM